MTTPEWHLVKVGLLGRVVTGKTPPSASPELMGDACPFITPSDLSFGIKYVNTERSLSLAGAQRMRGQMLPAGAVCYTCIGATIGKMCMTVESSCTNQQINSVVVNNEKYDPHFVYYSLVKKTPQIIPMAGGAATPIINKSTFSEVELAVPSLPTQRKIAAILSAYDDLIENNTRRVRVLEDMARALYREWFVEYRYPSHEHDEFVEDEHGRRPVGWERTTLGQRFITILGGTPSRTKPEYWNGEVPWLNSGKANELRVVEPSEYISAEGYKKSAAKMMPVGATIIAITGATLGQVSRLEIRACGNQSLVGLWGYENHQNTFIYLSTKLDWISQIVAKAGGGAQQHVNKDKINETEVLLPSEAVLKEFDGRVKPFFDLIRSLLLRNANLRRTRDLLLPRLVSGELDVSALDIRGAAESVAADAEAVA